MQLLPILLVAAVLAADGGLRIMARPAWLTPPLSATLAVAPLLVVLALTWARLAWCRRLLDRGRGAVAIIRADRTARLARALILLNHALATLAFDWVATIRGFTGDLVLVDEVIAIAPALLAVLGVWWLHYPIERRVREALLIRRLDLGRPVYEMPSRGAYVLLQLRLHVLLLLVPLLLILACSEVIRLVVPPPPNPGASMTLRDGLTFVAGVGVFVLAPWMGRLLLNVVPLDQGPLRADLLEICRRHRVRVRNVLLWRTGGTMINAAVMGLVGRLRYVLLTDALIETMPREHVLAVMAHEIGHVRRHHMPWLVASLLAAIGLTWLVQVPILLMSDGGGEITAAARAGEVGLVGGQLLLVLAVFGWVSRRFERQADTFAVQHLSRFAPAPPDADDSPDATAAAAPEATASSADPPSSADPDAAAPAGETDAEHVSDRAVAAMTGALDLIARLNAMNPERKSWRHGSIAWRQAYLRSIVGRPLHDLGIDRLIRRIKLITLVVLLATGAGILWVEQVMPRAGGAAAPPAATDSGPVEPGGTSRSARAS